MGLRRLTGAPVQPTRTRGRCAVAVERPCRARWIAGRGGERHL